MSDHLGDRKHHITLERMPYDPVAWDAIVAGYDDAKAFHTAAWLSFLAATQRAEPVVAVGRAGEHTVGCSVGAIFASSRHDLDQREQAAYWHGQGHRLMSKC